MGEDNRQEYYLDVMARIVEKEKEALGEEVALKWARKTPLKINSEDEITGFYGKGEDAVEILRSYTEHQEFYLECLQKTMDAVTDLFGEKIGQRYARQAPLEITPEGEIKAYYGPGRNALQNLVTQYEEYMGDSTANSKIRNALEEVSEDKYELLPEEIRPEKEDDRNSFLDNLISKIKTL
ncbi:MAG: hypothetical protein ACI83Q_000402 [Colwellia polaris]|jgi:hypothetical protein